MSTYALAFLMGVIAGLRSMTAPAVISWGARLGWLHLDHTLGMSVHIAGSVVMIAGIIRS